ncbi:MULTISPECIES: CoA ester lyase [unclassified Acinetobacter]|uniref:HpcH/HpaI aldolase/citrate lyase family protein n=1 Tax=unclassified Acinetobacter TaxID=196816 RepID=UPI00211E7DC8|nr:MULTISPECIES: CoA ester lyase [unclassified Acinetobacter]UUS64530.1 CoA ester lyase [Acinetobacter sp. YH12068_T]
MNKVMKSARSYLFVPANRIERFEKALNTDADAVIIDLEDAVPFDLKQSSRDALAAWLQDHPEHQVMIRVNSSQTEWFLADIELAKFPNVSAIVLPKAETSAEIEAVLKIRDIGIFPLIETPQGFANVRQIACTKHVIALMFGTIDFQLEMNMNGGYLELLSFRNEIVLASQLAKIQAPVDGVTVDFKDEDLIQLETQQAKNLGFAGKLCIHPNQVNLVNQTFNPSAQEITWANQIMQAVADAKGQAVSLNGKMIDLPVILQAQKIIDRAS